MDASDTGLFLQGMQTLESLHNEIIKFHKNCRDINNMNDSKNPRETIQYKEIGDRLKETGNNLLKIHDMLSTGVAQRNSFKDGFYAPELFIQGFFKTVELIRRILIEQENQNTNKKIPTKSVPEFLSFFPKSLLETLDMVNIKQCIYLAIIGNSLVDALLENRGEGFKSAIRACESLQNQANENVFNELLDDDFQLVSWFWNAAHARWTSGVSVFGSQYLVGEEGAAIITDTILRLKQ